jgi:hypothetical protein
MKTDYLLWESYFKIVATFLLVSKSDHVAQHTEVTREC